MKKNRGAADSGWRNEYLLSLLKLKDEVLQAKVIPFFQQLASIHAEGHSSLLKCFSLVRLVPLLKKEGKNDVRPIGVTEPLFKVIGLCMLSKVKDRALELFAGHQGNFN